MANLVEEHYLHTQKWNFFNYCQYLGDIDPKDNVNSTRITKIIDKLEKEKEKYKIREESFYIDFGAKDNVDWANKYLIKINRKNDDKEETVSQIVLSIINSPTMIQILYTGKKEYEYGKQERENLTKALELMIENSSEFESIPREILVGIVEKSKTSIAKSLGEFFEEVNILGATKSGAKVSNKQIQSTILRAIDKKSKVKAKPGTVRKITSDKLQKYERLLKGVNTNSAEKSKMALAYFREELTARLRESNKDLTLVDKYCKVFERVLDKNLKGENRLAGAAINNITGEVDETGVLVAYVDINAKTNKGNFSAAKAIENGMVKQTGRDKVIRGEDKVSSKVDTKWKGPLTGEYYYIQNKNTNASVYREFQLTNNIDNLPDFSASLSVNSEVQLKNLLPMLSHYRVLSEEDKDTLLYLIINYNVISKHGHKSGHGRIAKGKNEGEIPPAYRTQAAIDQILTQTIQYFLSDLILGPINIDGNIATKEGSNDFIIYQGRFLIPKSKILENFIEFLRNYRNEVTRMYVSTSTSFSASSYDTMDTEKEKIIESEPKEDRHGYHNNKLVEIGANWGEVAYKSTKIFKPSVKIDINNLIGRSLL